MSCVTNTATGKPRKTSGQADAVATAITNDTANILKFKANCGRKEIKIMSSYGYGGSVRMNPEIEENERDPMFDGGYPYSIPKVFLEGNGEVYNRQWCFNWDDDSVIVVRDKRIVKYTSSFFIELLAKNEEGEVVWMDGRTAPYSDCWGGEYLDEERPAHEYVITEYDLETYRKKEYKVILKEEKKFDSNDFYSLSMMVEKELLGSHFKIEDDVLLEYIGQDEEIVIPEGIKEIKTGALEPDYRSKSIKIPKTVEKISFDDFSRCYFENIEIDADNPRYLSKDGFVIDKVSQTLVLAHTGSIIPNDGSVKKIAADAFSRDEMLEIEIPDSIVEIEDQAFSNCPNIKYVKIPDRFKGDGERIFGAPLVKEGDKYRIDRMISDTWESPF